MLAPLLTTMALLAAAPTKPAPATDAIAIQRYQLDNGLRVVLHDDDRLPLVAMRLVYHVGQMHDPVGKEGVTHLLEHTMFGGSALVFEGTHASKLFRAGASRVNAYNSDTATVYQTNIAPAGVALALWLESKRMAHFDQVLHRRTIARERETVTDEMLERRRSNDLEVMTAVLHDLVFAEGHPLHRQDAASIARITAQDVGAMADRHYGPGNATLVLVGDLPDDVRELIAANFGGLSGGTRPRIRPIAATLVSTREAQLRSARAVAPIVLVAWPVPARFQDGDADADVLARVLESRGLDHGETAAITELHVGHIPMVGQSLLQIVAHGGPGSTTPELLAEIDAMITAIAEGGVSDAEVAGASRRARTQLRRQLGALGDRAELIVGYLAAGKPPDSFIPDEARYRKVTSARVVALTRAALHRRPRAIVHVAPSKAARR